MVIFAVYQRFTGPSLSQQPWLDRAVRLFYVAASPILPQLIYFSIIVLFFLQAKYNNVCLELNEDYSFHFQAG